MKEFFDILLLDHRYAIGAAIVLIVIVFIICEAIVQLFRIRKKKDKFEYKTVEIDGTKPTADAMNMITAGEWDLLQCIPGKLYTVYVLRRPIKKTTTPKTIK